MSLSTHSKYEVRLHPQVKGWLMVTIQGSYYGPNMFFISLARQFVILTFRHLFMCHHQGMEISDKKDDWIVISGLS